MDIIFCFWGVACDIVTNEAAQNSFVTAVVCSHESLKMAIRCQIVYNCEEHTHENVGV